jgi:hypothetical protein
MEETMKMSIISKLTGTGDQIYTSSDDIRMNKDTGFDISLLVTNGSPYCTESTAVSITETFAKLKQVHMMLNSVSGGDHMLLECAGHSLIVEAYVNAAIACADDLSKRPSTGTCWDSFRQLIQELLDDGYVLNDGWKDAIFGHGEEVSVLTKYFKAKLNELEKKGDE